MSKRHTLLIVDDCPEDREVYRDFLADDPVLSYQFLEAPLAEAGLTLFQQQPCDAILLDFYMPDMTGLEFLRELKRTQSVIRPPVIMLTGQGSEAVAVKAIRQGIQDYLVKQNLQPEALQSAVRNAIQQSHLHSLLDRTREQQRIVATTALRIRQSLELRQILSTTVAEVQQLLECDHVAVYQCAEPPCIANESCSTYRTSVHTEIGQRSRPVVWTDMSQADVGKGDVCEDLVAPILTLSRGAAKNQVWGYLVAHQKQKRACWQSDEQALVNEIAVQLAIAIQQSALLSDAQSALKKSQELIQFKSEIISTISHEYRTPLTAILAASSTLDRHRQNMSEEKQDRLVKMIQNKSRLMSRLIDDMVLMHQCDLDKTKFEPSPLSLLDFVADLVEEQRESASGASHKITLKVLGRSSVFWGDRGLLRFAIGNVIDNAVKYSLKRGCVDISLQGKEREVVITIQDEGIGIPAQDQPTLFESFSRGTNVGAIAGTGLGLSIAKACVELHSGNIEISSQESNGTKVVITLPKEPEAMQNLNEI